MWHFWSTCHQMINNVFVNICQYGGLFALSGNPNTYQLDMRICISCRDVLTDSGIFDSQMPMPHDMLSLRCCGNKWMNKRLLSPPNSKNHYFCLCTEWTHTKSFVTNSTDIIFNLWRSIAKLPYTIISCEVKNNYCLKMYIMFDHHKFF